MEYPKEVPSYQTFSFRPRKTDYCIIIPVLNENGKIQNQLRRMRELQINQDIILADGGSSDGSSDLDFLSEIGVRTCLVKTGPGKLSAQMRMGMDFALREGYCGIIFMDGNNKDNPSAIFQFEQLLKDGWDHIQGSRFVPGGRHENTPIARHLAVRLIHAPLISLASRFWYTDSTNGFRAYSRKFLLDAGVQPFRNIFFQYELHYYLAIRAARLGFRVIEIPVERCYPSSGLVPTKISGFAGYLLIMRTLFKACFGYYDPVTSEERVDE